MNWFNRLFKPAAAVFSKAPQATPTPSATTPTMAPSADGPSVSAQAQSSDTPEAYFLPWLNADAALTDAPLSAPEQAALSVLNQVLALPAVPDALLPRAAELVPKLISMLRESDLPLQEMAQRISRDAVLTAEVLRLASSPYYRVQSAVTDLLQAIQLIGASGLQTAIARVVLKPICRDATGAIAPTVAARLWDHSTALADRMAELASAAGQPRFDGYLLGMLHDTGWRVALHALSQAGCPLSPQPSTAFAAQITHTTHRLFGLAAQRWAITPTFTAVVADAHQYDLASGRHPLTPLLQHALFVCASPAPAQ